VLQLLAAGLSNQEIAARLFLALPTVKRYVGHILAKLEATSRGHVVARARELDLIL
jgi:DNA-binding CsgD family transcriptional regulator